MTITSVEQVAELTLQVTLSDLLEGAKQELSKSKELLGTLEREAHRTGAKTIGFASFRSQIDGVQGLLATLNEQQLSPKDRIRILRCVQQAIPKWLNMLMAQIVKRGSWKAYNSFKVAMVRSNVETPLKRATRDLTTQNMQRHVLEAGLAAELLGPKPTKALPTLASAKKLQLPAAAFDSLHLSALWKDLRVAWQVADKTSTQTEERYRIEQIAAVTLPESLRMFKSLQSASTASRNEAEALLHTQFSVMKRQLEQITQKHSDDALTALRAQTAFVESTAAPESTLTLPVRSA